MKLSSSGWLMLCCLLSFPTLTRATWSIVAVDPKTGEVGIAGASCTDYVMGIAGVVPGKGVIAAQAASNREAKKLGIKLLLAGSSPQQVITAVTSPAFDAKFAHQQYGVAALGFRTNTAAYTGDKCVATKGSAQVNNVSVQGNTLTDQAVIDDALAAFEKTAQDPKLTLADRLMAALEGGAQAGGDSRCGSQKARSSFLIVAKPSDSVDKPFLSLRIPGQKRGGANPIELLRNHYDQWRKASPQ